jgi:hypothetical protein
VRCFPGHSGAGSGSQGISLYYSHIADWRRARDAGARAPACDKPRQSLGTEGGLQSARLAAVLRRRTVRRAAEAKDGGGFRPRAADRFEFYPAEARRREADAVAEQHRQHIHQDLVHEFPGSFLALAHFPRIDSPFQSMVIVSLGFSCW